ncbi:hypothetical protein D9M69_604280 [compost metagenome]
MHAQQTALVVECAVIAPDKAGSRVALITGLRHAQAQSVRQLHHQGFIESRRPDLVETPYVRLQDVRGWRRPLGQRRRPIRHYHQQQLVLGTRQGYPRSVRVLRDQRRHRRIL